MIDYHVEKFDFKFINAIVKVKIMKLKGYFLLSYFYYL